MKTEHKQIIKENRSLYDETGQRQYYEIKGALLKVENGFLYTLNDTDDEWTLHTPEQTKNTNSHKATKTLIYEN